MRKLNIKEVVKPALGAIVGFTAAKLLSAQIDKIDAIPASMKPYVPGVVGVLVAGLGKAPVVKGIGLGMILESASNVIVPQLTKLLPVQGVRGYHVVSDNYGGNSALPLGVNGPGYNGGGYDPIGQAALTASQM
jgi:hypothetical protein